TLIRTCPPASSMPAAVARSRFSVRPEITTRIPSCAKRRAKAAPRPVSAPTPTTTAVPLLTRLSLTLASSYHLRSKIRSVPSSFLSGATEHENKVVRRHVQYLLQRNAMCVGGPFEILHVLQAPLGNLGGEDFLIEGLIRLRRIFSVDLERSIDCHEAVFRKHARGDLRYAVGDSNWRDLEQVDDENHVIEPILRVGPRRGRGEIDLDRIVDIDVLVIRALLLDCFEHLDVIIGRLKL